MSWTNKVVWSEGLFLQPQMFQQQERYLESFVHKRCAPLSPFFWGFSHYRIDAESLALGKLVLSAGAGVCPDGTPFDIPALSPPPPPLAIGLEHLEQVIYLAVPVRTPNTEETSFSAASDLASSGASGAAGAGGLARNSVFEAELRDANSLGQGPRPIQLSQLRLRLLAQRELTSAWMGLALAKVVAIRGDGSVELAANLLPPVNATGGSPLLTEWIVQLHSTARLRAQALANRLSGAAGDGTQAAEVNDYLMLQLLNRAEASLDCMMAVDACSPWSLYQLLRTLAAELATYARPASRRPRVVPHYDHAQPYATFKPLVEELRELMNGVLVRSAYPIELVSRAHGLQTASVDPTMLRGFQALVLTVSAQIPLEQLVHQFPASAKFGPSERLPELVRLHLPGLHLGNLPVPPRQIPYAVGTAYFEVAQRGPLWDQLVAHGGMALHMAVDIPGLSIQLWGVRA